MNIKGQNNNIAVWVIVGLLAVAVFGFGDNLMSAFTGEEVAEDGVVTDCKLDNVALTVGSNRLGKAGTEPGEGFRLFIPDSEGTLLDKGTKAEDSSTDVAVNSDFVIYSGENSTTYYTKKVTGNVDCANPYEVFTSLAFIDTTPTYVITNDDGTLNSAGALSIDQDEIVTIDITSKVDADQYLGNPQADNNLLTCVYNKTMFKISVAGASTVNTPNVHTAGVSTTNATATFEVALLADGVKRENQLTIEAIGNSDPGAAEDISCYEYDKDYDLNADTLVEILDVQDEDYNDLGDTTGTNTFTIDIS